MISEEYQMSMMGELKFFLGLQIRQQRNGIFMSQEKYLKDVLRKFGMQDCKGVKIPMPTNGHLCTDENGIDFDHKVYRSMIGSLLYLCASRPDIMLSVCMCAQYQAAPKECHLKAVKRTVRYLIYRHQILAFGILRGLLSILLVTPIQTMPETRLIESPLR